MNRQPIKFRSNPNEDLRYRNFRIREDDINKEERTVRLSFSSEHPVQIFEDTVEILVHEKDAVILDFLTSGFAPFLDNHDRSKQMGVIESVEMDYEAKRGNALVRFSKRKDADEIFQDILDGIRRNISVGYKVLDYKLEEEKSLTRVMVTKWEPLEVSIVSIPADVTVGVGRSYRDLKGEEEMRLRNSQNSGAEEFPPPQGNVSKRDGGGSAPPSVPVAVPVDEKAAAERAAKTITERNQKIMELGKRHKLERTAYEAILTGLSVEAAKDLMLEKMESGTREQPFAGEVKSDAPEKELKNYSFIRLCNAIHTKNFKNAGFERAIHQEMIDKYGESGHGGYRFPTNLPVAVPRALLNQRAISIGDYSSPGTGGGNLVHKVYMPFVDMLFTALILQNLGATFISDLKGIVEFAKLKSYSTGSWIGEDDDSSASTSEFETIKMQPYSISGYDYITRMALNQSSEDLEMLVRWNLIRGIKKNLEKAALDGSGDSDQPKGRINITGINTVDFAADGEPTFAEMVEMEEMVDTDDALFGALKYLITKSMKYHLRTTLDFSTSAAARPIADKGKINEYPYIHSNLCPAKKAIFGNWSDLLVGIWGAPELLAERDTRKGGLKLSMFMDMDVNVRHPESFCIGAKPSSSS
jgi:hypothetical protein